MKKASRGTIEVLRETELISGKKKLFSKPATPEFPLKKQKHLFH